MDSAEIVKLWRDKNFEGSYTGVKTFQTLLKLNKDVDVSEKQLYNVLKNDPIFVMHMRGKKNFPRRFYDLDYYGELVQSDLAYMFNYEGFIYFVVVIDCYSGKVFAEAIKDKTSETVKRIFIEAEKACVGRPARHCLERNIFNFPTFPIKKFLKLVKQNWVAISYIGEQHRFFLQQHKQMMMIMINAPIGIANREYQISKFAFSEVSDGVREVEDSEESSLVSSK